MKNRSKSFTNFIRRELSESEKLLINKYNNEKEPKQIELKNEDYLNITYNNKFSKTYFAQNKNTENIPINNIPINNNIIYKNINHHINNIDINKYNNNHSVNNNFVNLIESLLKKTQNIFSNTKKINMKTNSCSNIFNFKRITKVANQENKENINNENIENDDIPELIERNKIYSYKDKNEEKKLLEYTNRKLKHNLSEINITKKKWDKLIPKLDKINSNVNDRKYKKYLFDKKFSQMNIKMIEPYIYFSSYNNKNNKKIKEKKIKNSSKIDINNDKVTEIIKGYKYKFNNEKYKLNNHGKNELKRSFFQHSSILSELIYKNEK